MDLKCAKEENNKNIFLLLEKFRVMRKLRASVTSSHAFLGSRLVLLRLNFFISEKFFSFSLTYMLYWTDPVFKSKNEKPVQDVDATRIED